MNFSIIIILSIITIYINIKLNIFKNYEIGSHIFFFLNNQGTRASSKTRKSTINIIINL